MKKDPQQQPQNTDTNITLEHLLLILEEGGVKVKNPELIPSELICTHVQYVVAALGSQQEPVGIVRLELV